jgi:hypothetical protein
MPGMDTARVPTGVGELHQAIDRTGWYPGLVNDTLDTALAGEPALSFVVQHEPHFDADELRRHVTVVVLTPSRLVVAHADEFGPDDSHEHPYATASTESVPLSAIRSVVISRTVSRPQRYRTGEAVEEVVLTVGWGAVSRLDLEPAGCGDPDCEADHGYTGTATSDDLSLRVSAAADGRSVVTQTLAFGRALSAVSASGAPARA